MIRNMVCGIGILGRYWLQNGVTIFHGHGCMVDITNI